MKKIILGLVVAVSLMSCSDKNLELIKADLKSSDELLDQEIETTKFVTTKMISSDGKKSLVIFNANRKYIVATTGALFASGQDFCDDKKIKENSDVFYIEAFRFTTDTVFKKIYYINENKIVGKFRID